MTDVTGFGLAGHLFGICRESGVKAELSLDAIPLLEGAAELAAEGVRSHLYASNAAAVPVVRPTDPRVDLVFDPQTAGGFLAAVPAHVADDLVSDLRALGDGAAVIGYLRSGPPGIIIT